MPEFLEFIIDGNDLTPENYGCNELIYLLDDIRELLEVESGVDSKPGVFSLSAITEGSVRLRFSPRKETASSLRRIGDALIRGNFNRLKPRSQSVLRRAANREINQDRSVGIRLDDNSEVRWYNKSNPLPEIDTSKFITGETTLFGYLFRIGGEKHPTAHIRLVDLGYSLIIHIKKEEAKELSKHLYDDLLVLDGIAEWSVEELKICDFEAKSIKIGMTADPIQVIRDISAKSGRDWSVIGDPVKFVHSLYGKETED